MITTRNEMKLMVEQGAAKDARIAELEAQLAAAKGAELQLAALRPKLADCETALANVQRENSCWAEKASAQAAEISRLNALLKASRERAKDAEKQLAAATERERGYVALLGDIEWVLDKEYLFRYCPECDKAQDEGHAAGCRIAAALAAAQQEAR